VIGVTENYLSVEVALFEFVKPHAFNSSGGAYRHKDRSLNHAATGLQYSLSRRAVLRINGEPDWLCHGNDCGLWKTIADCGLRKTIADCGLRIVDLFLTISTNYSQTSIFS